MATKSTEGSERPQRFQAKTLVIRGARNLLLTILVLSPLLGYLGTVYLAQSLAPLDKAPWVHWHGLDPRSQVYVSWETESPTPSCLMFGTDSNNLVNITLDPAEIKIHHVLLINLAPDTLYYYKVGVSIEDAQARSVQQFRTAPVVAQAFSVVLMSDTQQMMGIGHYDQICKGIAKLSLDPDRMVPSFVGYAGDVCQEPDDQATWNLFFKESAQFTNHIPLSSTPGNHDDVDFPNALYNQYFTSAMPPTGASHAFNWSTTQFIMYEIAKGEDEDVADPVANAENIARDQWLNSTLAAGQNMDYRVLIFHRRIFSSLGITESLLKRIVPIVEKYNVSLVMYGHDHCYERFYYQNHTYVCMASSGGLQNMQVRPYEFTQVMRMGPSFTQLVFTDVGIIIRTMSPQLDVLDEIFLAREGTHIVPKLITPYGGLG